VTRRGLIRRVSTALGEAATRVAIVLMRVLVRLPYPLVRRVGEAAGDLVWLLARPRRHVTLVNLRLCFPHMTEAQRLVLARAHFRCFVRSVFDRFIFWYEPVERMRALTRFEGVENFLAHEGRPLIMLAPHFAGMDAGGMTFQIDHTGAYMYSKLKNRALNDAMKRGRERFGRVRTLSRNEGVLAAVRLIRDGVPFYFLPDMDLGRRDAIFVPFFGVPAATVTSVARIAKMTGAAVIPFVTRMTDTGYEVRIYPAWEDFPGDDVEAAVRRMNEFIEQRVLEMPEQYLWSHKRFKTRPPGVPGVYA
jgi:Kdo2-lipid IVA lauroyltransferase/acyltransferase